MTYKIRMDDASGDKYCSNFICALLSFSSIIKVINTSIRTLITNTYKIDTALCYLCLLIFSLYSLPHIIKRLNKTIIFILIFILLSFLISILLPNYISGIIISNIDVLLIQCIPLLVAISCVKDFECLLKRLYVTGYIILIANVILLFIYNSYDILEKNNYSQNGGYIISLGVLMILISQKKVIDGLAIIFGSFMAISMGARGPILVIAMGLIIHLLFINKKNLKAILLIIVTISIITLIIFLNLNNILTAIKNFLDKIGVSSRLIDQLLNGNFIQDNSRKQLIEFSINYIKQNPIFGAGLLGDRKIIYENVGSLASSSGEAKEAYIHNIFLEFMLQYGVLVGLMASIILILNCIIPFFKKNNTEYIEVLILAICCGLIPLLVSFSYVWYAPFYFLIGMLFNKHSRNKKSENY